MPETKQHASSRAKRLGFPLSNVIKGEKSYFIAPRGLKTQIAKRAYASLRSEGASKSKAAKIAHSIDYFYIKKGVFTLFFM